MNSYILLIINTYLVFVFEFHLYIVMRIFIFILFWEFHLIISVSHFNSLIHLTSSLPRARELMPGQNRPLSISTHYARISTP